MRAFATAIQLLVVVGAPFVVALWLRRRWPVSWSVFGAGAVTFVASQAIHLPLNGYVLAPLLAPGAVVGAEHALLFAALTLGLSAGLCEELMRFAVLRWWRRDDRSGPHGLAFGAGHGGIESILVGVLVGFGLYNVALIERLGIDNLGLSAETVETTRAELAAYRAAPAYTPLFGAVERLISMVFHVAASALVLVAVARRRLALLGAAVLWHGALDAVVVWMLARYGLLATEVALAASVPPNLWLIRWCLRELPPLAPAPPARPSAASGEPLEMLAAEKHFGAVVALDGVTFTIRKGERACLLGPNGAGKTTAIRLATGALSPTRGHALLFGAAAGEPAFLAAKRRTGIVPQQPGMYEEMTVQRYLELVSDLYRADGYLEVARRLGLDAFLDRPTAKLSGGWQRRLCLAAALLSQPDLLILDEPSAGLDPVAAREMVDLLREVTAGRTTLLCTHDLDEAEELCDSVVIMKDGRVLVQESIEALRRQATPTIALRAAEGPARLSQVLAALGHRAEVVGDEAHVASALGEALVPALLRGLLAADIAVHECRLVRPSLEDLFLQWVKAPPEPNRGAVEPD